MALPELHPEAAAIQGIMDEYQPELHIDYHGFNHAGRAMWESTGFSAASAVSRSFVHEQEGLQGDCEAGGQSPY